MLALLALHLACVRPLTRPVAADEVIDARFTDPAGRSGRYRMLVPPGQPDGVLFFFPWDGGGAAYAKEARLHAALAAEYHLILVSMRQPEGACWWSPEVEANARYVDAFLKEELTAARGVDPNRVFLTGLSGGADFASAFHYHTDFAYGGGVVALCGGDVPRQNGGDCASETNPPAAPALAFAPDRPDVRYDFAMTGDDPLLPASEAAAAFYSAAGFAHVRHRVVPGSGHCGFTEGWEALGALGEGLEFVGARGVERPGEQGM